MTTRHPWMRGPLLGAVIGLPILGGGGRLAMRLVAVLTSAPSAFTLEGTLTVLLAGLASGVGGGLFYALLSQLLPRHRAWRGAFFAVGLILVTLRGLHPVRPMALAVFLPLVVVYGVMVEWAWHRYAPYRQLATAA